jgi:hypothetical protein
MLFNSATSLKLRSTFLICAFSFVLSACKESGEFTSTGDQDNSAEVTKQANTQLSSFAEKIPENITINEGLIHLVQISADQQTLLEQLNISFEELAASNESGEESQRPVSLFPVQTASVTSGTAAKSSDSEIERSNIHFDPEGSFIRLRPADDSYGKTKLKLSMVFNGETFEKIINIDVKPINKQPVLSTFVSKVDFDIANKDTWPVLLTNLDPSDPSDRPINNPLTMAEDWGLSAADFATLNASNVADIESINVNDVSGLPQVLAAGGEPLEALFFF